MLNLLAKCGRNFWSTFTVMVVTDSLPFMGTVCMYSITFYKMLV